MPKFSVSKDEAIFEPIIVEIDGVEFPVREMDFKAIQKMQEFDDRSTYGSLTVPYERLEYLIGKQSFIRKKTISEVQLINKFIVKNLYDPVEKRQKKNVKGPGKKD